MAKGPVQPFDVTAAERNAGAGAEHLFSVLETPRLERFSTLLNQRPALLSIVFMLAMVALVTVIGAMQLDAPGHDLRVDLLPHTAVLALLIGLIVFPARLALVPVLTYALAFGLSVGINLLWKQGYVAPGQDALLLAGIGLLGNGMVAGLAALLGRILFRRVLHSPAFRLADVYLAAGTTLAYGAIASGSLLALAETGDGAGPWLVPALLRALRLGLGSGLFVLLFTDLPGRRHIRQAAVVLPLPLGLALLHRSGLAGHPALDITALVLVVVLFLDIYPAILFTALGLTIYALLTGEFIIQPAITHTATQQLDIYAVLLLGIIYLVLVRRYSTMMRSQHSSETVERLERVQSFSGVGYFVVDPARGMARLDSVGARMLQSDRLLDVPAFMKRIAPDDLPAVIDTLGEDALTSRTLSFHLASGPVWQDGAGARVISAYVWYENMWDAKRIAYGALLDMTQEKLREEALRTALAELSQQQDRQTQLFSIVSHELRTPASVISMLIEELDNGRSWEEMGPRLRSVSHQLISILGDMRQTVRPEQNLPIRLEVIRPQQKLETIRNTFLLMAEQRKIVLEIGKAQNGMEGRVTDRTRLNQAMTNLVKNAIIHSGASRIRLDYNESPGAEGVIGTFRITDNGTGIPEALKASLFEPFSRGGGSLTRRADGSGLGLFVSKTAIELLGGSIACLDAPGGGTVFAITLPLGLPQNLPAATDRGLTQFKAGLKTKSILLVEDSELIADLLITRLEKVFASVVWAADGMAGLAAYRDAPPDMVLTDLFMPKMSGDELTGHLRQAGFAGPIIGMTAAAIGDERSKFEAAGTSAVLTKPVTTAQLVETLHRVLGPDAKT